MMAMMEQINIKNQSSTLSFILISLPNSFRPNASGRTTQMVKHIADPEKAMIVSKPGINMARTVMTMIKVVRMRPFSILRAQPEEIDE